MLYFLKTIFWLSCKGSFKPSGYWLIILCRLSFIASFFPLCIYLALLLSPTTDYILQNCIMDKNFWLFQVNKFILYFWFNVMLISNSYFTHTYEELKKNLQSKMQVMNCMLLPKTFSLIIEHIKWKLVSTFRNRHMLLQA